jgi:hypothetical protein
MKYLLLTLSANIAVAIFKVGVRWDEFWGSYIEHSVSGKKNLMVSVGAVEEQAAVWSSQRLLPGGYQQNNQTQTGQD